MRSSVDDLFEVELFEPAAPAAGTAQAFLPGDVRPLPDEALGSWFVRMAAPFGIAPEVLLLRNQDSALVGGTEWWRRPGHELLTALARRTGRNVIELRAMTFAAWSDAGPFDEQADHFKRQHFRRGRAPAMPPRRLSVCSSCLADDNIPYVRRDWTLGWMAACTKHHTVLISECPACGTRLRLPKMSSDESFHPDRCPRCELRLAPVPAGRAHDAVIRFQEMIRSGRASGGFSIPQYGIVAWPVAAPLFDLLLAAVWQGPQIAARKRLVQRIQSDLAEVGDYGDEPVGRYEGLLMLAWMFGLWPERVHIALTLLRAPKLRQQLSRWLGLDPEVLRQLEDILLPAPPEAVDKRPPPWWMTWIYRLRESGDELRSRAAGELLPHRRKRLLVIADIRDGASATLAASAAGITPVALSRWLKAGAARGLEAALSRAKCALTDQQEIEIAGWLGSASLYERRWTAKQVCEEVQYRFGVHIQQSVGLRLVKAYGPWPPKRKLRPPGRTPSRSRIKEPQIAI